MTNIIAAVRSVLTYAIVSIYVLIAGPIALLIGVPFKNKAALYGPGHIGVGLALGVADAGDVVVLVEGERAGDIDHAVGERARREGGDGYLRPRRGDDGLGHVEAPQDFGSTWPNAPLKSATLDTQPKNFSML